MGKTTWTNIEMGLTDQSNNPKRGTPGKKHLFHKSSSSWEMFWRTNREKLLNSWTICTDKTLESYKTLYLRLIDFMKISKRRKNKFNKFWIRKMFKYLRSIKTCLGSRIKLRCWGRRANRFLGKIAYSILSFCSKSVRKSNNQ